MTIGDNISSSNLSISVAGFCCSIKSAKYIPAVAKIIPPINNLRISSFKIKNVYLPRPSVTLVFGVKAL